MIDISIKLKELREEYELKQSEVANRLNIARNTLSQFETGKARPSYEVLLAAADLFDVSTDYLLGRTEDFGTPTFINDKNSTPLSEDEKMLLVYYGRLAPKNKNMLFNLMKNIFEETRDIPVEKISYIIDSTN